MSFTTLELLEHLANIFQVLQVLLILGLAAWTIKTDWLEHKRRDFNKEIVISLNWFTEEPDGRYTLRIRNVAEASLIDAMGSNTVAAKRLIKAASNLKNGWTVVEFDSVDDADIVLNELLNQISQITGREFLRQAIEGKVRESTFVFAITAEVSLDSHVPERKIRVQLIRLEDVERFASVYRQETVPWQLEDDSERYRRRSRCLRDVVWAWSTRLSSRQGCHRIGVGSLKLAM